MEHKPGAFFIAMVVLIASLVPGSVIWIVLSLLVVLLTFIPGEQFADKVPDVHSTGFSWTVGAPGI